VLLHTITYQVLMSIFLCHVLYHHAPARVIHGRKHM
jgi:hypothetical protein